MSRGDRFLKKQEQANEQMQQMSFSHVVNEGWSSICGLINSPVGLQIPCPICSQMILSGTG